MEKSTQSKNAFIFKTSEWKWQSKKRKMIAVVSLTTTNDVYLYIYRLVREKLQWKITKKKMNENNANRDIKARESTKK